MAKLNEKQKKDKAVLSRYLRNIVFEYSEDEPTPAYVWRRIEGLRHGVFIPNKTTSEHIYYDYDIIYYTLKYYYAEIQLAKKNVQFTNEEHRINTVFKIAEKHLIDTKRKLKEVEKQKEKLLQKEAQTTSNIQYKTKSKQVDSSLEEFF